jgi:hypothetical protein
MRDIAKQTSSFTYGEDGTIMNATGMSLTKLLEGIQPGQEECLKDYLV